jgi:peptidylprolyl isomerase
MRIVSRFAVVALVAASLAACVSRSGPDVVPAAAQPPASSPVPGECDTTDIEVTSELDEAPQVTVPDDCAPPTTLLVRDLVRGDGPQAVTGTSLEVSYVLVLWSSGTVLDSTWYAGESLPFPVKDLGHGKLVRGWAEGLPGMREGGRRLIVVPPARDGGETTGDETIIYVVDAVRVTPR